MGYVPVGDLWQPAPRLAALEARAEPAPERHRGTRPPGDARVGACYGLARKSRSRGGRFALLCSGPIAAD